MVGLYERLVPLLAASDTPLGRPLVVVRAGVDAALRLVDELEARLLEAVPVEERFVELLVLAEERLVLEVERLVLELVVAERLLELELLERLVLELLREVDEELLLMVPPTALEVEELTPERLEELPDELLRDADEELLREADDELLRDAEDDPEERDVLCCDELLLPELPLRDWASAGAIASAAAATAESAILMNVFMMLNFSVVNIIFF